MKNHARVVVIGGGIGGCSLLYHLTKEGWSDVVLVERNELTSGTTWHSAAQCPNLAFNQLLILLRSYTIELYKELATDSEFPINYNHGTGGLRLITDTLNLDACQHIISVAKGVGVEFELLDPQETKRRQPLLETHDLLAALWDPLDGDIDPSQLCQSLARKSRQAGAEIYQNNPVVGLTQKPNHEWIVHTQQGDIHCEHIVNACGYRVNEVGKMINVEYPVVALEHMYFITEPIQELAQENRRLPMVRCPRDTFYMRQQNQGLLVGVYEHECKTFGIDGIDPNFVNALCENDLDRCLPKLEIIFDRLPCLKNAGIQSIINGPITYSADAGPLVGALPGFRNTWSMNGLRVGIGEGGGYGKMLAQQIVHGESEWDCWSLDPRRLTSHATKSYTIAKAVEDYQNEFRWHHPHEERPAGRPAKTTPLYSVFEAECAEFTQVNGWERVLYFKPDPEFQTSHHYRINNWQSHVENEIKHLSQHVSIAEISGMNRFLICGQDAEKWLDHLSCSKIPTEIGQVRLCYFLNHNGNVLTEATLAKVDSNQFLYCSAAAAEYHDRDWLNLNLTEQSDIRITNLTHEMTTLVVAGPQSRNLVSSVFPDFNWNETAFPKMRNRVIQYEPDNGYALCVSYSGEIALELHVPNVLLLTEYEKLLGENDLRPGRFGNLAMESMRIEMGYCHWKAELITEFNPMESGLSKFIAKDKIFIGKQGLAKQLQQGFRKRRVLLKIDSDEAPAQSGEGIFLNGNPIGVVTSAAWGLRSQSNLAMGYIDPQHAMEHDMVELYLLGQWRPAQIIRVFN